MSKTERNQIAENMKTALFELQWCEGYIANKAGVDSAIVRRMCNGQHTSETERQQVAAVLGVDHHDLHAATNQFMRSVFEARALRRGDVMG